MDGHESILLDVREAIQTAGTPAQALIPVRRFKLDAKPGSCAVRAVGC